MAFGYLGWWYGDLNVYLAGPGCWQETLLPRLVNFIDASYLDITWKHVLKFVFTNSKSTLRVRLQLGWGGADSWVGCSCSLEDCKQTGRSCYLMFWSYRIIGPSFGFRCTFGSFPGSDLFEPSSCLSQVVPKIQVCTTQKHEFVATIWMSFDGDLETKTNWR